MNLNKMLKDVVNRSGSIKANIAKAFVIGLPLAIIAIVVVLMLVDVAIDSFFNNAGNQVKLIVWVVVISIVCFFVLKKVLK